MPPTGENESHHQQYSGTVQHIDHYGGHDDNAVVTQTTADGIAGTTDPILQSDTYAEALRQLKQLEETAVRAKNYAVAARVQTATQAIETITAQLSEISRLEGTAVRERDYAAAEQCRHREAALLHDLDANLNWDFWAHDAPAAQTTQSQFDPNSSSAPFTGAGTTATQAARLVPVRFSVACETAFGDSVVLVGSAPQLGAWSLHSTIPMTFVAGETWTCECVLPAGLEFEFKFIQRKEHDTEFVDPMWQEGENFVGSIPVDDDVRTVDMRCTWGADGDAATQESESRGGVSGGNLVWICRSLRRREKKVSQKTISG